MLDGISKYAANWSASFSINFLFLSLILFSSSQFLSLLKKKSLSSLFTCKIICPISCAMVKFKRPSFLVNDSFNSTFFSLGITPPKISLFLYSPSDLKSISYPKYSRMSIVGIGTEIDLLLCLKYLFSSLLTKFVEKFVFVHLVEYICF